MKLDETIVYTVRSKVKMATSGCEVPKEEEGFGECAAVSTAGKGSCSRAGDWSDRHGEVSPAHSLGGPLQEQLPASEGSSEDGRDGPHPRVRGGAGVSSSSSNIP